MGFPDVIGPASPLPPGYSMPDAPGAAGVLTNDGKGNLAWQPVGTGGGGGTGLPPITAAEADRVLMTPAVAPLTPFWSDVIDQGRF